MRLDGVEMSGPEISGQADGVNCMAKLGPAWGWIQFGPALRREYFVPGQFKREFQMAADIAACAEDGEPHERCPTLTSGLPAAIS